MRAERIKLIENGWPYYSASVTYYMNSRWGGHAAHLFRNLREKIREEDANFLGEWMQLTLLQFTLYNSAEHWLLYQSMIEGGLINDRAALMSSRHHGFRQQTKVRLKFLYDLFGISFLNVFMMRLIYSNVLGVLHLLVVVVVLTPSKNVHFWYVRWHRLKDIL